MSDWVYSFSVDLLVAFKWSCWYYKHRNLYCTSFYDFNPCRETFAMNYGFFIHKRQWKYRQKYFKQQKREIEKWSFTDTNTSEIDRDGWSKIPCMGDYLNFHSDEPVEELAVETINDLINKQNPLLRVPGFQIWTKRGCLKSFLEDVFQFLHISVLTSSEDMNELSRLTNSKSILNFCSWQANWNWRNSTAI